MSNQSRYSGFIRVRVAGIFRENNKILLVKLTSPISGEKIWSPPGGGVEFKETLQQALIREFKEETSLNISVGELKHIRELIEGDFHVYEFFFDVSKIDGTFILGYDPEMDNDQQILEDIGFYSREEINSMNVKPEYLKRDYWENSGEKLLFSNR